MIRCLSPWALIKRHEMANLMRTRENCSRQTCCIHMPGKSNPPQCLWEKEEIIYLNLVGHCLNMDMRSFDPIKVCIHYDFNENSNPVTTFISSVFFFPPQVVVAFQISRISFQRFDEIYWLPLSAPQWQNGAVVLIGSVCICTCAIYCHVIDIEPITPCGSELDWIMLAALLQISLLM